MTTRPWWSYAIQWGLWAVIMVVVLGWMSRSRMRPRSPDDAQLLVQPKSILIVGWATTGFFVLLAVLSALFPGRDGSPAISLVFVAFAGLGALLLMEHRNARHRLTADGMEFGGLMGRGGTLRWSDVRSLRYAQGMKWFRLDLADGRVVRISAMLSGLPQFATAALANVGEGVADPATRAILAETAAGNPPPIWG